MCVFCFWCFCHPFHKKWRPKQGKAFKMKWIQIGSNCPLPLPLPFVCCPLTLPLGASEDSQKAEEYAHLTRSASWQGQFRVLESIQYVGRLLSSEIAVSRWILKDLSVVFRVGVIEIHEDHQHCSSPMKTTKTDAINEANFTSQPRNTSSWKLSFVALRRSSKDRSRLGDGYWGGVIWRAKSLNSQWSEYVCHNVLSWLLWLLYYVWWNLLFLFSHWQVNRYQLQDAMPWKRHLDTCFSSQQGLFTSALPRPGVPSPVKWNASEQGARGIFGERTAYIIPKSMNQSIWTCCNDVAVSPWRGET